MWINWSPPGLDLFQASVTEERGGQEERKLSFKEAIIIMEPVISMIQKDTRKRGLTD